MGVGIVAEALIARTMAFPHPQRPSNDGRALRNLSQPKMKIRLCLVHRVQERLRDVSDHRRPDGARLAQSCTEKVACQFTPTRPFAEECATYRKASP